MDKAPKAYRKKVGKDESEFWDKNDMPLRHTLVKGGVIRIINDKGEEEFATRGSELKWQPSAEFTKFFKGKVKEIAKKLKGEGELRFLIYLVDMVEEGKDYVNFNIDDITKYLEFENKKSTYKVIDSFVDKEIISKRNGGKQRYSFDVYSFYNGVYPDDKVAVAIQKRIESNTKKKKEKDEQKANRKNADAKSDRAKAL